ncbi:MAG TPA: DUF5647 family protein [Candidatus Brocadiales bacterium]|nr:DUF5647 family protein [Candidatus Brocadiales bacterium]
MKPYSKLVAMLSSEFQKYLMKHPEMESKIPEDALIIFRVEGEKTFNEWSRKVSLKNREKGQPAVTVIVQGWREAPFLEEVRVEKVAV